MHLSFHCQCGTFFWTIFTFSICIFIQNNFWVLQRLPFDWKNLYGYLAAVIFQYIVTACIFLVVSSTLSMGIGTMIFQLAMLKDLRYSLQEIHNNATTTDENGRQALDQISVFIDFHLLIKQLSKRMIRKPTFGYEFG